MTTTQTPTRLIPLAYGTRVRYDEAPGAPVEGIKEEPIGMAELGNLGFRIRRDDGSVAYVSRYAFVTVVEQG